MKEVSVLQTQMSENVPKIQEEASWENNYYFISFVLSFNSVKE